MESWLNFINFYHIQMTATFQSKSITLDVLLTRVCGECNLHVKVHTPESTSLKVRDGSLTHTWTNMESEYPELPNAGYRKVWILITIVPSRFWWTLGISKKSKKLKPRTVRKPVSSGKQVKHRISARFLTSVFCAVLILIFFVSVNILDMGV